jgi:hypothetical protein
MVVPPGSVAVKENVYDVLVYPDDGPDIAGAFGAADTVSIQLDPQLFDSFDSVTVPGVSAQRRIS